MIFAIFLIYLITCFFYYVFLFYNLKILECIYQNSSSKNRIQIKEIRDDFRNKKTFLKVFFWPLFEFYYIVKRNEWKYSLLGLFDN